MKNKLWLKGYFLVKIDSKEFRITMYVWNQNYKKIKSLVMFQQKVTLSHRCTQEGEEGGTSCIPSEDFENLNHKNAIKHENRGPP